MADELKRHILERGPGIREGLKNMTFDKNNLASLLVALVFSLTGAVVVFVKVGKGANFTSNQTVAWIAFGFLIAGIVSALLTLYYKMPILSMPTLSGVLVIGPVMKNFTISEIVGAFVVTALILMALGATGIIGKISKYLPVPIVMGMVAGVYMSYGTGIITSINAIPLIGLGTLVAFLLTPLVTKKIPQQAVAVVVGVVLTLIFTPIAFDTGNFIFHPAVFGPAFSPNMLLSLCIPLVLVSIADLLKCYGVLRANEFQAPVNSMVFFPALGSLLGAFVLSAPLSMTGVITAILSDASAGVKERRYAAAVVKNLSACLIGICAGVLVPFLMALPSNMTNIIAGLAMLGLFLTSLGGAFGGKKFKYGAFTAFIVSLSNLTIWGVSAAVWAIIFGLIISFFMERDDFKQSKPAATREEKAQMNTAVN